MNDLDLCLDEVVCHVNHCVTFDVEYLGNRYRQRLDSEVSLPSIENGIWTIISNGHVTDDVT